MVQIFLMMVLSQAANFTGDLFEVGSGRSKKVFMFERVEENPGPNASYVTNYKNLDGSVAVGEKLQFKDGEPIVYELDQKQLGAKGKVEFKDGKMIAIYTVGNEKKDPTVKEIKSNLIISPLITGYIRKNWQALTKGEKVDAQLYVLDKDSTYSFEYAKVDPGQKGAPQAGADEVIIRMKPGNFIVARMVDPIYFVFSKDSERLVKVEGRALPKRKDGSKWKDLVAEAVYKY